MDITEGEQVDVRRYLGALWRSRFLIALIVLGATIATVVVSLILPKTYEASALIVLEDPSVGLSLDDAASVERRLATADSLVTSPDVLDRASEEVGESRSSLEDSITSSVDESANIVHVVAWDRYPSVAAAEANQVARAFLSRQRRVERERLAKARESLLAQLEQLERVGPSPENDLAIQTLQERISRLGVSEPVAGSELQLAQPAEEPTDPSSPRPGRNGVIAGFAALLLGVLIALGREQLVPRVSGQRELSRITDLPVLSIIPYAGRRGRRPGKRARVMSGVEEEAYQSLRAAIKLALPPEDRAIVLVTSAVHGEGKSTVTARLGMALAQAGNKVLLVSADLRWPTLHQAFARRNIRGFSEALAAIDGNREAARKAVVSAIQPVRGPKGDLHVMTSGSAGADGVSPLSIEAVGALFEVLRKLEYDYVLVDGPPLLGVADTQVLAQQADRLLLTVRLDRVTVENVIDTRDALDRLDAKAAGLVVIGSRLEGSPYYYAGGRVLQPAER
jgi:capsular exopolysaccharide synthesis family protein